MHPVYEYIVSVAILLLVLSYSFYAVNSVVVNQLTLVKEEQLKDIANRLFDKILYTPGYPVDWGSNIYVNETNLIDFGVHASTGDLQKLDIDKLNRLIYEYEGIINPQYIPPETVGRLLGIYENGHWIYGFRLLIKSALNITIQPLDSDSEVPVKYKIKVVDYVGKDAANALVEGILCAVYNITEDDREVLKYDYNIARNLTMLDGTTILNFEKPEASYQALDAAYALLVTVNYYGLQSQGIWTKGQVVNLINIGDYLIVNLSSFEPPAARQIQPTAIEFTTDLNIILNPIINETNGVSGWIINKGRFHYRVYKLANPITEDVTFIGLAVVYTGKTYLVFASRPNTPIVVDYGSHSFPVAGLKTETIYGLFRISDNTYYAQLTVWRMSE